VAGSVVPRWHPQTPAGALVADYRRIMEWVEGEPIDGEGVSAKELTGRLGPALVSAKTEAVRSKAKRLVERGWLTLSPTGRFTPRPPTGTARAEAVRQGGPDDGS
jgi:hypothetical protein